jgi:hypothetical protein
MNKEGSKLYGQASLLRFLPVILLLAYQDGSGHFLLLPFSLLNKSTPDLG